MVRFPSRLGFQYSAPASSEETDLRRVLIGAILEFGEPHAFESGAMTRPLTVQPGTAPKRTSSELAYYMLQEDGNGFAIFGALRMVYDATTAVEPVRFAVQFVTTEGTAVIDVAVPSRYAPTDKKRTRSYEEQLGPHMRVSVLTHIRGAHLANILAAFAANRNVPARDFVPLLRVMREQGETKKPAGLKGAHLKLLAEFIRLHFGDFSEKASAVDAPDPLPPEIIPESPDEVPSSDGWVRGVAEAAEAAHEADRAARG